MKNRKTLLFLSISVFLVVTATIYIYMKLFSLNIRVAEKNHIIYIPTESTFDQVLDTLETNLDIKDLNILKWLSEKKSYPKMIKPGRYIINKDLSYIELINLLRSGKQEPVKVTFNNIRSLNQLAGKIGLKIEADSLNILSFLSDESNYVTDGFKKENIIGLFIPNTYEFYWNTDAKGLYSRMKQEYHKFWDEARLEKAKSIGLDPMEVSILASIIDDEVAKPDEKPRIAGVYLNRLNRGIPLQACPTIKYALNDFTITRVLYKHLQTDSPYNTYKYRGFPPGPIGCPSIEGIDAVLNAEKHNYLYFAAKADFSGYHNFSQTLAEHNRYASIYQRELNKRKIFN